MTPRTGFLLPYYTPTPDTELMELMATGETERVLNNPLLSYRDQELVPAHCTSIRLQGSLRNTFNLVVS